MRRQVHQFGVEGMGTRVKGAVKMMTVTTCYVPEDVIAQHPDQP